jgi:hypothetical protein
MKKGGEAIVVKHRDTHTQFIHNSMSQGRPANLVIVLDTHSDAFSGQLQATGGLTGVSTTLTLPDLVRTYVGDNILEEMARASALARSYTGVHEISPGVAPWADITPRVRGGWRVMVMVACGSAVRQPVHWDYITQLFTQYVFPLIEQTIADAEKLYSKCLDLLIGFGGHETMPHDVQPFVNGLVEKVAIHGIDGDIWRIVRDNLIAYPSTVTTNTVIAAYATDSGFVAREIGMHRAERPLGYHFASCGTADCPSKERPGHILGELRDMTSARIRCKTCKWRSKIVKLENQDFFRPLHATQAPLLFHHAFPSPPGLSTMFL